MTPQKYLTYSLIRCADDRRDEALNVGVLVLDGAAGAVVVRTADDLGRVKRALPNTRIEHLRNLLTGLPAFFADRAPNLTPASLAELAAEWSNGIRLSGPRTIAAATADEAADALFTRCVRLEEPAEALMAVPQAAVQTASSGRNVKSIVSRLHKRGFEPGQDYETDAKVIGRTAKQTAVPVWFPLRVGRHMLIDSMDVKPREERRTIDNARLIAAKTDEVLRANGHRVSVVIREGPSHELNELVQSLLLEEGAVGTRGPELHLYSDLDKFVERIPRAQLELPDDVDLSDLEQ
jgi:hypothetical protein